MFLHYFKPLYVALFVCLFSCIVVLLAANGPPPPQRPPPQGAGLPQLPNAQQQLMLGKQPKNLADMMGVLQRTQALLLQLTIRIGQVESRQNMILKGRDGRDGDDGKQGSPGRDGRDGKDGPRGAAGVNGAPGQPGRDGKDGEDGKTGPQGDPGKPGARGPQGPKGDNAGGLDYIRWGRTKCLGDSELVYSGRIGGEYYQMRGGGTNYLCLPENPRYGKYKDKFQKGGIVFGTVYRVKAFNPFKNRNLHDKDAPCSVCYVKTRSTKLMIPATNMCPAGWKREYNGYLMTSFRGHHASEYICVDEDAEGIPRSGRNVKGALLYPVESQCGTLPCKKYLNGRELTCVVCSK